MNSMIIHDWTDHVNFVDVVLGHEILVGYVDP